MTELNDSMKKFIILWGERGSAWGINRTVAQIFALLYLSKDPLNADQIRALLNIARSNVSQSLHELKNWNLITSTRILGERKEYYECQKDVNEIFASIFEERKRREFDPALTMLQECALEMKSSNTNAYAQKRIEDMNELFQTLSRWSQNLNEKPLAKFMNLFK